MCNEKFKPNADPEMREFEEALLRSVEEGLAGVGRVNKPEQIVARRSVGRPVQTEHKMPVTLRPEPEMLAAWWSSGKG